jgi:RNA polymerase sigma-54 factor
MRQAEMADLDEPAMTGHAAPGRQPRRPRFLTQTPRMSPCRPASARGRADRIASPEDLRTGRHRRRKIFRMPAGPTQAKGRGDSLAARIVRDHFALLTRRRIPELARKLGGDPDDVQWPSRRSANSIPPPAGVSPTTAIASSCPMSRSRGWRRVEDHPQQRLHPAAAHLEHLPRNDRKGHAVQGRARLPARTDAVRQVPHRLHRAAPADDRAHHPRDHQAQKEFFETGVSKLKPLTMTQIAMSWACTKPRSAAPSPTSTSDARTGFSTSSSSSPRIPGRERRRRFQHEREGNDRRPDQHGGQRPPPQRSGARRKLQEKGITIARRTVAKYREELGLLPSNLRRDYA